MNARILELTAIVCALAPAVARAEVATPPAAAAPADAPSAGGAAPADPAAPEPFAWGDFTWLNGSSRQHAALLDSKYFTGTFTADVNWVYSFNHPVDHTIVGSTATFREGEFNVSFIGAGGDLHWNNVRGRLLLQLGTRATGIARNDGSADRGQYSLRDALRYVSEAYGGYHWDVLNGINLDIGIFMSYVGLFSYNNFENWAYQPSYTSDNTPWFFNGARLQIFPTDRLKVELWLINGWQTYAAFNTAPGLGFQILYRPKEWVSIVLNGYAGTDTAAIAAPLDAASRVRFHSDNSLLIRYYNSPGKLLHRAAFSITGDLGVESGAGVTPFGGAGGPNCRANALATGRDPAGLKDCTQNFIAAMAYNRLWFANDLIGWTFGGGFMHNPGRYLVLPPTGAANPFNALNTNMFTMNPGDKFDAWDASTTLQIMPSEYITWSVELVYRHANVPYFAGRGGVTSATGYYPANIQSYGDPNFVPDLRKDETRINLAMLVRF
jgi:hypothetical protein